MNDSPNVRRSEADGVLTITFTRDDKLNAVDASMLEALQIAVGDLAERDDLRVLLITAEGRYFTSGIDITTMRGAGAGGSPEAFSGSAFRQRYRKLHDFYDRIEASEKPVVLAAQGPCLGLGVEMGASCDFRIASDAAVFGLPELPNLALIPGSGGISRMTRLVGPHWAAWLALAGETMTAADARMAGFVHAVYPVAEFAERAQAFALRLARLPREATAVAKLAIRAAESSDRASARDFDRLANTLLVTSQEHADRKQAFADRARGRK
ncbi:hypothetical protein BH09PSE5_BH09PSE5_44020 [soil metagenome]